MKINYFNQTKENTNDFENLINNILKKKSRFTEMNIIFVGDEEIKRINLEYRNKDYITDVISFPNNKKELGEIFICVNQAKRQSIEYNHSLKREIGFLAVHGYLHLLGYDHIEKNDEILMIKKQEEILKKAKLERGGIQNGKIN